MSEDFSKPATQADLDELFETLKWRKGKYPVKKKYINNETKTIKEKMTNLLDGDYSDELL